MDWKKFIKTDIFCISLLILVACLNVLVRPYFGEILKGDTGSYVYAAELISGDKSEIIDSAVVRMLKPLPLWGVNAIAGILHIDLFQALLTEALIFYFLLAVIIYYFLKQFFGDNKLIIVLGSIVYISGYPLLKNGLSLLSETGAHFFYVLAALCVYLYYKNPNIKYFLLSVFSIVIGFHWKEYSAVTGLFFLLIIVFHPVLSLRKKIFSVVVYGFLSLSVIIPWQMYTTKIYNYSYLDWLALGSAVPFVWTRIYYTLKSLFGVFLFGWVLVIWGAIKWKEFPQEQRFVLKYLSVACLLTFVWSGTDSRLFYVLALPGVVLLSHAFSALLKAGYKKTMLFSFVLTLFVNYLWLYYSESFRVILDFLPYS